MKQVLGDNQFFGINHYDLSKGSKIKERFGTDESITEFIIEALEIGLDGFMMNSNERGYKIVSEIRLEKNAEIHYSVPYPHKFATIVNENGMIHLFRYILSKSNFPSLFVRMPLFLLKRDFKDILPLILDLEIPKKLPEGSYVYLQNIVTDLVLGLKRKDLLLEFCKIVIRKGYRPGLITLNPVLLEKHICTFPKKIQDSMILCFNINKTGFNVFPSRKQVEKFINQEHSFKKMGMSILSSGGINNIQESLNYIKLLPLDYVVYGSSKINNIQSNYNHLKQ